MATSIAKTHEARDTVIHKNRKENIAVNIAGLVFKQIMIAFQSVVT